MRRTIAAAVSLAMPALAVAHDFRVERTPDAFVVRYGHRGGELLAVDATDSKGEIRLRPRSRGLESISTSIRRPHVTPEADEDVLEASLTFEVAR